MLENLSITRKGIDLQVLHAFVEFESKERNDCKKKVVQGSIEGFAGFSVWITVRDILDQLPSRRGIA